MCDIKINRVTVLNYEEYIVTNNTRNTKYYNITKDSIVFWVNAKKHTKYMLYNIGIENVKKYERVLKENGYKLIEKD